MIVSDLLILKILNINNLDTLDLKIYLSFIVVSYVLGRLFEQIGIITIHYNSPPFLQKWFKYSSNPKWSLLFDEEEHKYTESFKDNVIKKLTEWLANQNGEKLIKECKEQKKDDYFNIIQFYLRERFPAVALYEKKQNATIILSRSLALIFLFNLGFYHVIAILHSSVSELIESYDSFVILWIVFQAIAVVIFYSRFIKDKYYHAMYIIEAFIATKKMLKTLTLDVERN